MGPTALLLLTSLLRSSSLQASVRVSPDRSQFFKLKSVSLSCDRDWTVTRNTSRETGTQCGVGWGTLTGSLCKISTLYSWDSGLYWCESREGQASDTVSIRVKDGGVVLQSPLLPVTEGQTVSLSCLHHTSSILPARFHRDGHFLSEQPTGHMTIQQVSVSDEGLYHCEIQGELSESSWLHVTASVRVSPDQTQFFKYDSVSLSCDRDWTVTRNTSRRTRTQCGVDWGTLTGSLCKINRLFPWDSGLYWCESREGQASDTVSIRVKDGGVVLQSPVLPVTEGQTVSLSCLHHTSSILPARFHRDGHFLSEQPTGHMTIQQVSVSDEGLYHCEIQGNLSESSWLHVTPANPKGFTTLPYVTTPTSQAPPRASGRPPALALLCHLVVFCPYVVSTVLMVTMFRTRTTDTGNKRCVSTATQTEPGLGEDYDDVIAVTTEHQF